MSYRDPYAANAHTTHYEYNPYDNNSNTQYQGGYRDEPFVPPAQDNSYSVATTKEGLGQEKRNSPRVTGESASAIRAWRYDHQGNLWTKGGRGRCVGRFCCCGIMTFIFLFASIVLTLLLFVRPPNVVVLGVDSTNAASTVKVTNEGLSVNLGINMTVDNPNFFSVSLKSIKADLFYPGNNTNIGGGEAKDVVFKSDTKGQAFNFPLTLNYQLNSDPNHKVLLDLATKCGIIGGSKSDITIDYTVKVGINILFVTVSPSISNSVSMACPLQNTNLEDLAKLAGIDLNGILGSL